MSPPDRYPEGRLSPANTMWRAEYAGLAPQLVAVLGDAWRVEHVGSTSVPGLLAKPVIDVALGAPVDGDSDGASERLAEAGWTSLVPVGDHQATFLIRDGVRAAIGHVFTHAQWPEAHVRLFAQWLREHADDRDRYARLKQSLVAQQIWGEEYTSAKGEFVLHVVNQARRQRGLPLLRGPL
ncbi:GrpB family protein [Solicola sp. PLA-1-18]|uniref:GrpB family protein n=1 Tax=Solicola sp. PLA-1-18 TaxID=3380532 RepID=UPI003B77DEB4